MSKRIRCLEIKLSEDVIGYIDPMAFMDLTKKYGSKSIKGLRISDHWVFECEMTELDCSKDLEEIMATTASLYEKV